MAIRARGSNGRFVAGAEVKGNSYIPFEAVPEALEQLPGFFAGVGLGYKRRVVEDAFLRAVELSPVGTFPDTSDHPGKYRASHTISKGRRPKARDLPNAAGYPVPGKLEAEQALDGIGLEDQVWLANAARTQPATGSYARALERGHSPQAPGGIYGPTFEWLSGRLGRIYREVADEMLA